MRAYLSNVLHSFEVVVVSQTAFAQITTVSKKMKLYSELLFPELERELIANHDMAEQVRGYFTIHIKKRGKVAGTWYAVMRGGDEKPRLNKTKPSANDVAGLDRVSFEIEDTDLLKMITGISIFDVARTEICRRHEWCEGVHDKKAEDQGRFVVGVIDREVVRFYRRRAKDYGIHSQELPVSRQGKVVTTKPNSSLLIISSCL